MSCCGRGGSWFGTCGSAGNSNTKHTWYEGMQACKPREQSKTVNRFWPNGTQQNSMESYNGTGMVNSNEVNTTAAKTFAFSSAQTSTPMLDTAVIIAPVNASGRVLTKTSVNPAESTSTPHDTDGVTTTSTKTPPQQLTANTSMVSTFISMLIAVPPHKPDSTTITAKECSKSLNIVLHISLLLLL